MASLKLYKSEWIPQGIGGILQSFWLQKMLWFPCDKCILLKLTAVPRLCVCLHKVVWIAVLDTSFFIICKHENNFSKHGSLIYCHWNAAISGCASCISMFKKQGNKEKGERRRKDLNLEVFFKINQVFPTRWKCSWEDHWWVLPLCVKSDHQ